MRLRRRYFGTRELEPSRKASSGGLLAKAGRAQGRPAPPPFVCSIQSALTLMPRLMVCAPASLLWFKNMQIRPFDRSPPHTIETPKRGLARAGRIGAANSKEKREDRSPPVSLAILAHSSVPPGILPAAKTSPRTLTGARCSISYTQRCRRMCCTSCRCRCAPAYSCRIRRMDRLRSLASSPYRGRTC